MPLLEPRRKPKFEYGGRPKPRPDWDSEIELRLWREAFRRDFWTYFQYGFGAYKNPKGKDWIDPDIHIPMADWFQHHVFDWLQGRKERRGQQKHLAVLVHREVGKTTLFSIAGQSWLHVLDPEISTYTGSERTELSMKILGAIQSTMDGSDPYSLFTKVYGNWANNARKWTGKAVTHAARKNTSRADPSLGTFAVETSIVGAHPDAIFYDDPISYERMTTDTNWLAAVNSQVTSLFPVVQSDGLIVWVGTRYDDDDHFGVAFREEGVASLTGMETDSITVDPVNGKWHVYFMSGRDSKQVSDEHPQGKPSTPKVWPEPRLVGYQKRDPLRYASQILNDPTVSEFNPITRDQLRQCIMASEQVPWSALRYAITCDTAFRDGDKMQGKDETVYQVWGYPRNGSGDVYFVEGYSSNSWRAEDLANRLVATVQRYRRQGKAIFAITDEATMAGKKGAWRMALQNYFHDANERMPNFIIFDRHGKKKGDRLVNAASFWVDGHVRIVQNAPGSEKLIEQMSKIGQYLVNQKIKIDWADAASDVFEPELYQPMRRKGPQKAPWLPGARPIFADGLDPVQFDDEYAPPREPV